MPIKSSLTIKFHPNHDALRAVRTHYLVLIEVWAAISSVQLRVYTQVRMKLYFHAKPVWLRAGYRMTVPGFSGRPAQPTTTALTASSTASSVAGFTT